MAERGGFETPIPFEYSRFPGVRVKPLCHLSTRKDTFPDMRALFNSKLRGLQAFRFYGIIYRT